MAINVVNIFDVSAEQNNGRVTSLRRKVLVEGVTSTTADDYIEEIIQSGVVPSGSITVAGDILYLRKRSFQLTDQTAIGDAMIDLVYERQEFSSSDPGGPGVIRPVSGGTSLKGVQTEKDRQGAKLSVTHTYSATDKGRFPDNTPRAGQTDEPQGGLLSILMPMSTLRFTFNMSTDNPGAFTQKYVSKVNATSWQGEGPRTWLCTVGDFNLVDDTTSPRVYQMSFTFELDVETWDNDCTIRYTDPLTGKPPDQLVDGVGVKQIQWYEEEEFNTDF